MPAALKRAVFQRAQGRCEYCGLAQAAQTRKLAAVFHPRRQAWSDHFQWKGCRVVEVTATGRATVEGLRLNRALAQAIRAEERLLGRHPPPSFPNPKSIF